MKKIYEQLNQDMWDDEAELIESVPKPYHRYRQKLALYSKDFSELTEEYLLEKYEEISNKTWNFDKLFMPFWKKQIETEYGLIQE